MNEHPNLPKGAGDLYVKENIGRALRDLCSPDFSWRERILEACTNAHRPEDTEFFTGYMSDETLEHWRNCSPYRFEKRDSEISDSEMTDLAEALRCYIRYAMRDMGLVEAGMDPKEFDSYRDRGPDYPPPSRNKI